jgi:hypothetical protein
MEILDFEYEDEGHVYTAGDGVVVPSVTEGLKRCGIFDYSMVDPALLEFKRQLGSNVHAWTADVDRYGLQHVDPLSVTPLERGFGQGWLNWTRDVRPKFLAIEEPMMRVLCGCRIAGTPDRIAQIGNRLWVVDIKCSAMTHPGWGLQLADYEAMWTQRTTIGAMGRMIVRLTGDGRYSCKTFSDPLDGVVAMAGLRWVTNPADTASQITVENWKRNMRITREPI